MRKTLDSECRARQDADRLRSGILSFNESVIESVNESTVRRPSAVL
jgi:hypothetical protein